MDRKVPGVEFTVIGENADFPDALVLNAKQNKDLAGACRVVIVIVLEIHSFVTSFQFAAAVAEPSGFVTVLGRIAANAMVARDDRRSVTDPRRLNLIFDERLELLFQI